MRSSIRFEAKLLQSKRGAELPSGAAHFHELAAISARRQQAQAANIIVPAPMTAFPHESLRPLHPRTVGLLVNDRSLSGNRACASRW